VPRALPVGKVRHSSVDSDVTHSAPDTYSYGWRRNSALVVAAMIDDGYSEAEQARPYTNEPLSVSPLTWSRAALVSATRQYADLRRALNGDSAGQEKGRTKGS